MTEWFEKKKNEWYKLKYLWPENGWEWKIRNIINFVDDPIDDVKHKIHGLSIFGYKIYLPVWLMKGSGKEGK